MQNRLEELQLELDKKNKIVESIKKKQQAQMKEFVRRFENKKEEGR